MCTLEETVTIDMPMMDGGEIGGKFTVGIKNDIGLNTDIGIGMNSATPYSDVTQVSHIRHLYCFPLPSQLGNHYSNKK